jgi:hypothetical protein
VALFIAYSCLVKWSFLSACDGSFGKPATCRRFEKEDKMRRSIVLLGMVAVLVLALAVPAFARGKGNPHGQPVVYVTGQSLAYDSIVLTDVPFVEGAPYQLLEMGVGPTGLQTEFGPGDVGYVGGRWWDDVNGNGEMDAEDDFFLCPLLGPGYVPTH